VLYVNAVGSLAQMSNLQKLGGRDFHGIIVKKDGKIVAILKSFITKSFYNFYIKKTACSLFSRALSFSVYIV